MQRKKILRRAAVIGLVVLVTAVAVALGSHRAFLEAEAGRRRGQDDRSAELAKEYQATVEQMAKKVKTLPVDPKVVGDIQAMHFQQRPDRMIYVWGTANDGRFLFGVPSDAFARLNTVYDQNQQAIAQDNHFANRDQFLRALLHRDDRRMGAIRPPGREEGDRHGEEGEWWRFYNEERNHHGRGARPIFLSSPIQDASGTTVGNLNMKLIARPDEQPVDDWSARDWDRVGEVALGVAVVSLLWLWFLVPSWVYIDAQQKGVPRPLLWALLTIVGNVVGLLVYLISRPTDVELRCPHCARMLNGSKAGCPYCGADLSAVFCTQCQYPLKPDWAFCPSCRTPIAKTAPGSAVPATTEPGKG